LGTALQARLERLRRRYTIAGTRIASFDLRARIRTLGLRLLQRSAELGIRIERVLVGKVQRLERLRLQLEERGPLSVLERGYAICTDAAGNLVRAADQVAIGDEVNVQLARGRLGAEVRRRDLPKK
jgi:exodeoxyribonuclease VII large subunit